MHEPEKHKKCPCCEFTASRPVNWALHIDNHHPEHGEKKFFCKKCQKGFIFKLSCTYHYCKNSDKRRNPAKLKCLSCDKTYLTKQSMDNHIKSVHIGLKPFLCDQCEYITSSKSSLNYHIKTRH